MKLLIALLMLNSLLFSKECYFNKVKEICYYKYFDTVNIYKVKADENYYINKKGQIYAFDDIIEVKFNSIGAIFTLRNDFELEFVDKIKREVYLFRVEDRRDLFPTISKLNRLKTVMKAQPYKKRKYTKSHIALKKKARKERVARVLEKKQNNLSNKKEIKKKNVGFDLPVVSQTEEKKSFLQGNL